MNEPTIESIRRLSDDESFIRGRGYLNDGSVYDAMQTDERLTGRSLGNASVDYAMEVILGPGGVVSGRCTCPRGGFCKHLVALALLPLERPGEVIHIDKQELTTRLREYDHEELVKLIVNFSVQTASFGRRVVEFLACNDEEPSPVGGVSMNFSALITHYQERAERLAPGWHANPYHAGHDFASAVRELLMQITYEATHDPMRLLAGYTGIYKGIENTMEMIDDSDGAAAGAAWECVSGMQHLVGRKEIDRETRLLWVRVIVPLYLVNDYGIGDELYEPIAEIGSTTEAEAVIAIIQAEMRSLIAEAGGDDEEERHSTWSWRFRKMITYELVAELLRRSGREEEIDSVFIEGGLHYHCVLHRIANGNPTNALEHACEYIREGYDVMRAAQAFLDAGMVNEVRRFLDHVAPMLPGRVPYRREILSLWALAAEKTGDIERALDLRYQAFDEDPSVERYVEVIKIANALGSGNEYDQKIIKSLSEDNRAMKVLTEIHIHRRDVDPAIETFDRISGYRDDKLALRLATAASKSRPKVSRRLITDVVEKEIDCRKRSHYARAASVAARLRDFLSPDEFTEYLIDLRARYRRLPALLDEFNRVFDR